MSLIKVVRPDWTGLGAKMWGEEVLQKLREEAAADEQLVIFRGENDL